MESPPIFTREASKDPLFVSGSSAGCSMTAGVLGITNPAVGLLFGAGYMVTFLATRSLLGDKTTSLFENVAKLAFEVFVSTVCVWGALTLLEIPITFGAALLLGCLALPSTIFVGFLASAIIGLFTCESFSKDY